MDKYEFEQKSGLELTDEEYEKLEYIYLHHPENNDFIDVTSLARYVNKHGLKNVLGMYMTAVKYQNLKDQTKADGITIRNLTNDNEKLVSEVARLTKLVKVYKQFVKPEDLLKFVDMDDLAMLVEVEE